MAVYDPEIEKKPDPPQSDGLENQFSAPSSGGGMSEGDRAAEVGKLEDDFNAPTADASPDSEEAEPELSGLYKDNGKGKKSSMGSKAKGIFKKKGLVAGLGGGAIGITAVIVAMVSHLAVFQADTLLKGIDQKTQVRMMASLDARNHKLVQAYVRARMLAPENDPGGTHSLVFRADKVRTGSPFTDWYKTMQASKFETDLFNKQGIKFTGIIKPDGTLGVGVIDMNGAKYKTSSNMGANILKSQVLATGDITALNKLGSDMEKFVDVQTFGSHKEARQALKVAVNDNTQSYQFFKRRHIRKSVMNMTGIKSWRLFETSRDKLAKKKKDIRNNLVSKMVDKYYSGSPATSNLLKCLFSSGKCPTNTDPESSDSKSSDVSGTSLDGNADPSQDAPTKTPVDPDGTVHSGSEIGNDLSEATTKTLTTASQDAEKGLSTRAAAKMESASLSQKIVYGLVAKITGKELNEVLESAVRFDDPTQYWRWATRIAKIDGLVSGAHGSSKILKAVVNARRSQVMGILATLQIGASQLHTGQVTGPEVSSYMDLVKGFGNSEGWDAVNGHLQGGTAAAAASTNLTKNQYCAQDASARTIQQYAWVCPDQSLDASNSNAAAFSQGYDQSVGLLITPISSVINGINGSFVGKTITWANNLVGSIIGKLSGPLTDAIMNNTGLGKSLTGIFTTGLMKLITYLGGGPMFDGSQPGNVTANLAVAGGSATAETTMRDAGGIVSTPQSLAYSTNLADNYLAEQRSQQSMYDRYASLSNPDSLFSDMLMSIHPAEDVRGVLSNVGSVFTSFPRYLGTILTGNFVHAATGDSSVQIAKLFGTQMYDIPQVCINLDPLDPNYLDNATNAADVAQRGGYANSASLAGSTLGGTTMQDNDAFWKAVYAVIGPENEAAAGKIYNCALLDAQAEDSLGSAYGYSNGSGLDSGSTSNSAPNTGQAKNNHVFILGDSYTDGMQNSGIEQKLQAQGWVPNIDAACGRPLHGTAAFTRSCDAPGLNGQVTHNGLGEVDQPDTQAAIKSSGAIVIGLGTNDAGQSPDSYAADVTSMISKVKALNPSIKIYWINLYNTQDSAKLSQFDSKLTLLASGQGFTIIDWSSQAAGHYSANSVHPNLNDGYGALISIVLSALGKAPSS